LSGSYSLRLQKPPPNPASAVGVGAGAGADCEFKPVLNTGVEEEEEEIWSRHGRVGVVGFGATWKFVTGRHCRVDIRAWTKASSACMLSTCMARNNNNNNNESLDFNWLKMYVVDLFRV